MREVMPVLPSEQHAFDKARVHIAALEMLVVHDLQVQRDRRLDRGDVEFLKGSLSEMDLSLIYPQDPTQLPEELAGAEWPPKD